MRVPWIAGGDVDRERLRNIGALVTAGALLAVVVGALHEPESSGTPRRAVGEVIGLQMYAELTPPPSSTLLDREADQSRAAPGRPNGYRRAVVITEPGTDCDHATNPVACGAKLEIFRRARDAMQRSSELDGEGERVHRRGALVLRMSDQLTADRRQSYTTAFEQAADELDGLADVARIDR